MKSINFLIFLFLLGLSSCAKDIVDLTCTIEGVVKDKDSGVSLSNCEVLLSPGNKTIATSNDGLYSFKGLEPGEYTLFFNKNKYFTDSRNVVATAGETIKVEMLIKAKVGPIIEGVVKDKDSGVSLSNCEVLLSPGNKTIVTSNDGLYSFKGLEPGEYTLSFNKSGYNPDSRKVTANYGDTIKVEMLLKAKSSFSLSEVEYDYGDLESTKTFTCFNHSASDCVYTLSNLPEWIITDKNRGIVKAGSNDSFTLMVDRSKVNTGKYNQNITIEYSGQISGTEVLLIKMSKVEYTTPTVTTATLASSVNENSFSIEGTITATGGSQITSYGHCWSTSENPTINDQMTNLGMTDKICSFRSTIENLLANTTYYVRAYATNSQGTAYGEQIIVKTTATEESGPWDGQIASSFAGGSGTAVDPYIIKTGGQLLLMKEYEYDYFRLANDIDLNNNNWLPIDFGGYLDGNGHTIYNLKISRNTNRQGLFSCLTGTIENLKINGVNIYAPTNSNIGCLAGEARRAFINNCEIYINSTVLGNQNIGGIVGTFYGPTMVVTNCKVNSSNLGILKGNENVGGLIGSIQETRYYSDSNNKNNHVKIDINGGNYIGGCYGRLEEPTAIKIFNHSYSGMIKGSSVIGGIVGSVGGSVHIYGCKADLTIDATKSSSKKGIGGILGNINIYPNSYIIKACYSTGNISFSGSYGGIVDYETYLEERQDFSIEHCYTTINDNINYAEEGDRNSIYKMKDCTSVYETNDVSQTMFEFYSSYAEYWNYKNTWIWHGEVNGEQVSIPCPKLAWEE